MQLLLGPFSIYHLQMLTSQGVFVYTTVKINFILLQGAENLVFSFHLSPRPTSGSSPSISLTPQSKPMEAKVLIYSPIGTGEDSCPG